MVLTPEEQRARLAQLLQEKVRKPKQAPLSFAQERMWFLEELAPATAAYAVPVVIRMRGLSIWPRIAASPSVGEVGEASMRRTTSMPWTTRPNTA